jgi:hypothetical protein
MTASAGDVEGSVVGHLGACGSGKTYRMKLRVAAAVRSGWPGCFVVADVRGEWPAVDGDRELGPLLYGSPAIRIRRARVPTLAQMEPGAVVVCRPRGDEDLAVWFEQICKRAQERGGVVVVAPEVWRYAREHQRMSRSLERLVHEHRHTSCGLWWDAQSFPETSKELIRRSGFLFVHGTGAHEDLKRLEAIGGRELAAAVLDAQRRNVQPTPGNARGRPGHHVVFRAAVPIAPYQVRAPSGEVVATHGGDGAAPLDGSKSGRLRAHPREAAVVFAGNAAPSRPSAPLRTPERQASKQKR